MYQPLNKGHIGTSHFVRLSSSWRFSYGNFGTVLSREAVLFSEGPLSSRFHCQYYKRGQPLNYFYVPKMTGTTSQNGRCRLQ